MTVKLVKLQAQYMESSVAFLTVPFIMPSSWRQPGDTTGMTWITVDAAAAGDKHGASPVTSGRSGCF